MLASSYLLPNYNTTTYCLLPTTYHLPPTIYIVACRHLPTCLPTDFSHLPCYLLAFLPSDLPSYPFPPTIYSDLQPTTCYSALAGTRGCFVSVGASKPRAARGLGGAGSHVTKIVASPRADDGVQRLYVGSPRTPDVAIKAS